MKKNRSIKLMLVLGLAAPALAPVQATAGRAIENTPPDSVLVVTANLEEAWNYSDTQNHGDMDRFVTRVLDEYRYKPDILLLQEVRGSSASYVTRQLTRKSNQRYQLVVKPPADPYFPYGGGRAGAKETAIVINTTTMKTLNSGGYFPTVAKASHEVEPHDPVFHQAYALLQRRGTPLKFATMSVHLLPRGYLATTDLDTYYRNKWAKQMHSKLQNRYGGRKGLRFLMGGDFNQSSCLRGNAGSCSKLSPFWKTLKGIGYEDTSKDNGPVDYIFSKKMPGALHGMDSGYKSLSHAKRYSDHAFRWTILGPDRYDPLPPKPMSLDLRKNAGGNPVVVVGWGKSDDRAGSGVVALELWRKINDGQWTQLTPTHRLAHYDGDMEWQDTVRYRVRVKDAAGNYSSYVRRSVEVLQQNL